MNIGQASSSERLGTTRCDFCVSKVIRLSIKSCLDPVGSQLEGFRNVCYEARSLEELFFIFNCQSKWVGAFSGHETWPMSYHAGCVPSKCIMESNIGLYLPYWSDRQYGAITRLHIPSQMVQEVFVEEISLMEELWKWMNAGTDWKIEPQCTWFLEKQDADADLKHEGWIVEDKGISKVSWRGHTFVLKETGSDDEFNFLKRVSVHQNIVPGFGVLCKRLEENEGVQKAYFMEHISDGDLLLLIVQEKRRNCHLPPFLSHDALNILLQFAKAVEHMHQEGVIHCDLKSENVLVSNAANSTETTSRYLVKVADFGSAKERGGPSDHFIAGDGTTWCTAPESLQQRESLNKSFKIHHPDKIDVYSFGVVAFELLTRENYYEHFKKFRSTAFKAGVIYDNWRPPLRQVLLQFKHFWDRTIEFMGSKRQFFERYWHLQQEDLIFLVEKCWHQNPAERPSFQDICKDLGSIDTKVLQELNSV